jgi:DnaJ-class molecular chaperone
MTALPRSYYQVLGVAPDATPDEIHRAYRRLARLYHPDLNRRSDARARFDEVSDAYAVLHDPALRAGYDRRPVRRTHRRSAAGPQAPNARPSAPAFSSRRPARAVPRFLEDESPSTVRLDVTLNVAEPVRLLRWLMRSALRR